MTDLDSDDTLEPSEDPNRRDRYMMATTAHHKLGDISRDHPDLAVIYGETDTDWIGQWAAGFGLVNVRFPKAATRELTEAEKAHYHKKVVVVSGGAVEEIRIDGSDLPKLCGHGINADCECCGDDQPAWNPDTMTWSDEDDAR